MQYEFGAWLKKRRRILDLTQDDLAVGAHCSVNTIRKIEAGDLLPSKTLAQEIARALDLPADTHAEFVRFARTPTMLMEDDAFSDKPAAAPPPAVPTTIRFRIPAALATTIGREHDTNVITRVLRLPGTRLVTLTGPPGTGKTRLSLEVAAELEAEFEHGAAFVALAPIAQAGLVESTIAQALEIRAPAPNTLQKFLRDKQLLLVLDNFEHVLDAAPLVNELLGAAPRVKILTTSRERLRVYGEREIPITPLGAPPLAPLPRWDELEKFAAVQLFIERAQAVRPDFELNETNAEAIARLCAGLDGLPLAIEMAAARVKWEAPSQILAHLARRLEILTGRARDLTTRQRTLRGAIDWSYEYLDANEQKVLRHLGVFRGEFTVEFAQAVAGVPVLPNLQTLVEKSLVKRNPAPNGVSYFSLLETIRDYALEKLTAADEAHAAHERHASFIKQTAHAIGYAREYGPAAAGSPWQSFDARWADDFRSALEWLAQHAPVDALELASDLLDFWADKGLAREGRAWLKRLLIPETEASPLYVTALVTSATLEIAQGNLDQAATLAEQARQLALARDLPMQRGKSLQALGYVSLLRGDFAQAENFLLDARAQYQALGLRAHEARALNNLGLIAKDRSQLELAETYHQTALGLRRELGMQADIAQSLFNVAIVAYWRGDFERAIQTGLESYNLMLADDDPLGASYVLETVGMAQFKLNRLDEATASLQESVQFLRRVDDKRGLALILNALGDVSRSQKNFQAAAQYYREALALCLETGEKRRGAFCLEGFAAVAFQNGQSLRAAQLLGAASALRQEIGAPHYPTELPEYQEIVRNVSSSLAQRDWENAWQDGEALTLMDAIALVLEEG